MNRRDQTAHALHVQQFCSVFQEVRMNRIHLDEVWGTTLRQGRHGSFTAFIDRVLSSVY